MRRLLNFIALASLLLLITANVAMAWQVSGRVVCAETRQPVQGITVRAESKNLNPQFVGSDVTDVNGAYLIEVPEKPACYNLFLVLGPEDDIVTPGAGYYDFCMTLTSNDLVRDWVITSPKCEQAPPPDRKACWMTGGGRTTGRGRGKPEHSYGGNVNPGCSPSAGEGGNWNHIAHVLGLHFQGRVIEVVRCDNVPRITPGSESPVTPFNLIEFRGTGTLRGIARDGRDHSEELVHFRGLVEDREEPGSHGQPNEDERDRYFLNVFSNPNDPVGSSLFLFDRDGNPATTDPRIVSTGNLQIHVTSCESPDDPALIRAGARPSQASDISDGVWLAATRPNPARHMALVRFAVPQATDIGLAAFDVAGRKVVDLWNGGIAAGEHEMSWDLRDAAGQKVRTGVYFVRLAVGDRVLSRAVTVVP